MKVSLVLAGALAVAVVAGGCTGVPGTSSPQGLGTLAANAPTESSPVGPAKDALPREVVSDFLNATADGDPAHKVAQIFLTPSAYQRWSPTTVTIVDQLTVSNLEPGNVVKVSGHPIGELRPGGIYQPENLNPAAGQLATFTYGMTQDPRLGWRINTVPQSNGAFVIDAQEFDSIYQQRTVYFFDSTEKHLIADPRYSALADLPLLANWLVAQIAAGPQPALNAATTPELPGQAQDNPTKVTVTVGSPAQVQVPGAAQLDVGPRTRLAAQLAYTLAPAVTSALQIVDNGRPVTLENGATTFTEADFPDVAGAASVAPTLYYVSDGHVLSIDGKTLAPSVTSAYKLTSVAVAHAASNDLRVAGTYGTASHARLVVGSITAGMQQVQGVQGSLSRPTWAPFLDEAWVGDGATLYRVPLKGSVSRVPISSTSGQPVTGDIAAVRFSPDGGRVALVLRTGDGSGAQSQLWVGGVSRGQGNSGQVQVTGAEPITPQSIQVLDAAWNGALTLFAISSTGVYELQADGSLLTSRPTTGLPGELVTITVAENQVAWVESGKTIWEQQGSTWASPGGGLRGVSPVYLE